MNKKAIAILGGVFLLIIATLGVIIYLRSSSGSDSESQIVVEGNVPFPVVPEVDVPEPIQPDSGSGENQTNTGAEQVGRGASKLTDEAVITPALFFQGNGIAYFNRNGQLFRTDMAVSGSTVLLSNKTELTIPPKTGINRILWPAVGSSFIAESGLGIAKQWSYYNPATGQYIELPSQVKSVSWMPAGDKIVFVWVDANNNSSVNKANPDTSEYESISELYDSDTVLSVSPDGRLIAYYRSQNSNQTQNVIFTSTINGTDWTNVVADGFNKGVLWSPDSRKILFSKRDPATSKFSLWVVDLATGQSKNLGVSTLESKAVWTRDSQSIVVAVPTSGTAGEGFTQDTIYKIDVGTGSRTEFTPGSGMDAQELFLSVDENILFFRNAQDGYLYYLFVQ